MAKRIILADTNWWISLVIAKFDNSFASILENEDLEFCSCNELENEISDTLKKPKLQKFLSEEIVKTFWLFFHLRILHINLTSVVNIILL
jgi:putative PIN family toxin of toxin-antitoxin system